MKVCGIAFTSFSVGARLEKAMRHRGPDAYGWDRTSVGELHHSRLAINGLQPQPIVARDGTLTVYNGEIYEPRSVGTDATLVAELFASAGHKCLEHFNGAWAFLQVREDRVVAVRDRFGLRPLFRYFDGKHLVYASDVSTIALALSAIGVSLSPRPSYPTRGRIPQPSAYVGVTPLPAGVVETATFCDGRAELHMYRWYERRPENHGSLESMIEDAVRIRVHEQGALAVSGGADSYVLHALAPPRLPRYHLDVTGEADAAEALGAVVIPPPTITKEEIDDVLEQPFYTLPPNLFLAAAMKRHDPSLRVVLTGLGADELFGGYRHHSRACTPSAVEEVYELRSVPTASWRDVELDYSIPYHYGYRTDRAFLRYGLEVRHPFMDHRVVETALCSAPDGKTELRRIAQRLGWTPQAKRGFSADLSRYVVGSGS